MTVLKPNRGRVASARECVSEAALLDLFPNSGTALRVGWGVFGGLGFLIIKKVLRQTGRLWEAESDGRRRTLMDGRAVATPIPRPHMYRQMLNFSIRELRYCLSASNLRLSMKKAVLVVPRALKRR